MNLSSRIKKLRAVALILFFTSSLSLVGSLAAHNYLVSVNFDHGYDYSYINLKEIPGDEHLFKCDQKINTCDENFFIEALSRKNNTKLNQCFIYLTETGYYIDNQKLSKEDIYGEDSLDGNDINYQKGITKTQFKNSVIYHYILVQEKKDASCIKNFKSINLYNIFPMWFEGIDKLQNNLTLASSEKVNPFIYGELSISNMVKRYPINFIFKPLLFIASFLMISYWINYNFLFKKILRQEKNYFYYFGLFSAIFLFLHVWFLGSEIENEIFQKMRRLIMILFILCELIAQVSLTRQLYKNSKNLSEFCHLKVINLKIFYIIVVFLITCSVLFLLIFYNFESKIDYILEWNYFLGLLLFYFLSFIMWKKINN